MAIHPTALVSEEARLGDGVEIGPFCTIGAKVTIGDGCRIGAYSQFQGTTTIGAENIFGSHSSIGADAQDLGYDGREAFLEIGDRNRFGDYVQLCRGTIKSGDLTTRIGSDNFMMAYTHVGHDCQVGDSNTLANGVMLAGHVELEGHVVMGGSSGVHQFCAVGKYAMISGLAASNGHVPPFVRDAGFHGGRVQGLNTIGLQRSGEFTKEDIRVVKDLYKIYFRSGLGRGEAMETIRASHGENRHAAYFLGFLERMQSGDFARRPVARAGKV